MENWDNWIFLALSVLLSIPVGIFVNLVTPSIDTYLKNRSLSANERQIKTLLIRYINIKNQKEHRLYGFRTPMFLGQPLIFWLPFISIGLIIVIFELLPNFGWFSDFLMIIAYLPMYYSSVLMFKGLADMRDLASFDGFKRRTIKKLKKLGCNPRDYGIE